MSLKEKKVTLDSNQYNIKLVKVFIESLKNKKLVIEDKLVSKKIFESVIKANVVATGFSIYSVLLAIQVDRVLRKSSSIGLRVGALCFNLVLATKSAINNIDDSLKRRLLVHALEYEEKLFEISAAKSFGKAELKIENLSNQRQNEPLFYNKNLEKTNARPFDGSSADELNNPPNWFNPNKIDDYSKSLENNANPNEKQAENKGKEDPSLLSGPYAYNIQSAYNALERRKP